MSQFCLLADPKGYVAADPDFLSDETAHQRWLDLFASRFDEALKFAAARYGRTSGKQIVTARSQWAEIMARLRQEAASPAASSLVEMCRLRESVLRGQRLNDPFAHLKTRHIESALGAYPDAVRRFHKLQDDEKWLRLVEGIFAGNLFETLGPEAVNSDSSKNDFFDAVDDIKERPWLIDDYDRLAEDLPQAPPVKWTKAVVFVSGSGNDFILGVMPFVRELALGGAQIVLAANELPSFTDITADETVGIIEELAGIDNDLAALVQGGLFEVVSTGNDLPVLDLSSVSDELNAAAADADLVILEGAGRAVETNRNAVFTVDTLWLALLTNAGVAHAAGGALHDCVCKYRPIERPA